jgi:hypothetical protein
MDKLNDLIDSFDEWEELPDAVTWVELKPELLLHPNIPKPLHGIAPRTIVSKSLWDEIRRGVYKEANYCCEACGVQAEWDVEKNKFAGSLKLHAHEDYEINYEFNVVFLNKIVCVCPTCHDYIHSGRANSLYDKGVFDEEDMWIITTHGDRVLMDSGLDPLDKTRDTNDYKDEWLDWYLEFNGKEYRSKFKSYEEWKEHYKED